MLSCDWTQRCTEPARHRVEQSSRLHPVTLLRVCDQHLLDAEQGGYRRRGSADGLGGANGKA